MEGMGRGVDIDMQWWMENALFIMVGIGGGWGEHGGGRGGSGIFGEGAGHQNDDGIDGGERRFGDKGRGESGNAGDGGQMHYEDRGRGCGGERERQIKGIGGWAEMGLSGKGRENRGGVEMGLGEGGGRGKQGIGIRDGSGRRRKILVGRDWAGGCRNGMFETKNGRTDEGPNLMSMLCSSTKGEGATADAPATNAETASAFQGLGDILDSLADCLICRGKGAPTTMVLKLQRNTIILLAFLASSGRHGFELLLGRSLSRRTNFLHMILQVLASEIDVESSECIQPSDDFRERTLLIREALILLNRLASNSQYSTPVLRVLTKRRDMAILTIDIASRLSRKDKWLQQSDTMTRQMRESEIADLARIFKKRVFNFLGDTTPEK
ncbi:hypothetical protein Tco_0191184 [Tanacetum coccineum]